MHNKVTNYGCQISHCRLQKNGSGTTKQVPIVGVINLTLMPRECTKGQMQSALKVKMSNDANQFKLHDQRIYKRTKGGKWGGIGASNGWKFDPQGTSIKTLVQRLT